MPRRDSHLNRQDRRRILDRLRALAGDPAGQRTLAAEALAAERDPFFVQAALQILGDNLGHELHDLLVSIYEECDRQGPRRDPGGALRAAIVTALRRLARPGDAALFASAASRSEPSLAGDLAALNAAGLLALDAVDPGTARLHAVRMLAGGGTAGSGEPAATAARLLAASGESAVLYLFALGMWEAARPEPLAEAIAGLHEVPGPLLLPVLAAAERHPDSTVVLAAIDLVVGHAPDAALTGCVRELLGRLRSPDLYRYLVTAIIASHRPDLLEQLLEAAALERRPEKVEVLVEALSLARAEARVAGLLIQLRERLERLPREPARRDEGAAGEEG